jgi:ferredoxin
MKVMVNGFACDGHSQCVAVAPESFRLGTDGKAYALSTTVPENLEAAVLDAQRRCPNNAVMVLLGDAGA